MDPLDLLKELENARAHLQILQMDREKKRAEITAPVAMELADLDTEFQPVIDTVTEQCARLEEAVKTAVIKAGESVKGEWLHAIHMKGRESWNGKALTGYAAAHPEILAFRTVGDPTVSIRVGK